jgi:hypothetical protein
MNGFPTQADFNKLLCGNVLVRSVWMAASRAGLKDDEAIIAVACVLAEQNKALIDAEVERQTRNPPAFVIDLPNPDVLTRAAGDASATRAVLKTMEAFMFPPSLIGERSNYNYAAAKANDRAGDGS